MKRRAFFGWLTWPLLAQQKTPIGKQKNVGDHCPVCLHLNEPFTWTGVTGTGVTVGVQFVFAKSDGTIWRHIGCEACNGVFQQKAIREDQ